jgi:pyruvate dehydrogenase complex dehydrogenase (E1) component
MFGPGSDDPNVMYYLTVYNEPIVQPPGPEDVDVEGIVRGIYRVRKGNGDGPRVHLLACWGAGALGYRGGTYSARNGASVPTSGR